MRTGGKGEWAGRGWMVTSSRALFLEKVVNRKM